MGFRWADLGPTLLGSIVFYTAIPLPHTWPMKFEGIAKLAPIVGLLIGCLLLGLNAGLDWLGMPLLLRLGCLVTSWIGITGGLHLDGAMDTADGLAVMDRSRRLDVMADSATGAFGAMTAMTIGLLKILALLSLTSSQLALLPLVLGWARWGQLVAIVRYPYLRAQGKGALHKEAIRSNWAVVPTGLILLGLGIWADVAFWSIASALAGVAIGAYFQRQLGGQTGDTYGAIVEWTEVLSLCLATVI